MQSKSYRDGEYVVREGEAGDSMYLVISGEVEVVRQSAGRECYLAVLGAGQFFGEMALIDEEPRNASVRALGQTEVLPLDRANFLAQMQEDSSLAYELLGRLQERIRDLSNRLRTLGALLPDEAAALLTFGSAYPQNWTKDDFIARVKANPSVALRTLQEVSSRIREMNDRLMNVTAFNPSELKA